MAIEFLAPGTKLIITFGKEFIEVKSLLGKEVDTGRLRGGIGIVRSLAPIQCQRMIYSIFCYLADKVCGW